MSKQIHTATVNGQEQFRVYHHGEVTGTFTTKRNAKLFKHSDDMLECIEYFAKAYRNDIQYNAPGHIKIKLEQIISELK